MEILLLLIPMSVVLAIAIGVAFWWSVRSGQFDDLEGPAHRILADDDGVAAPSTGSAENPSTTSGALTSVKPAGAPRQ
jgi:cbb3-type cytochrome oxidase maturation protein